MNCTVTYPRSGSSFVARYEGGAVKLHYMEENGTISWETFFRVEGAPALGDKPLRRYMTNNGTFAAYIGGQPVVIERA